MPDSPGPVVPHLASSSCTNHITLCLSYPFVKCGQLSASFSHLWGNLPVSLWRQEGFLIMWLSTAQRVDAMIIHIQIKGQVKSHEIICNHPQLPQSLGSTLSPRTLHECKMGPFASPWVRCRPQSCPAKVSLMRHCLSQKPSSLLLVRHSSTEMRRD